MSSELIGPVSGTSRPTRMQAIGESPETMGGREAGGSRKGGGEIWREARCNFRVAGILNLQVRPAPDRLCEQVPGVPISISR